MTLVMFFLILALFCNEMVLLISIHKRLGNL